MNLVTFDIDDTLVLSGGNPLVFISFSDTQQLLDLFRKPPQGVMT